MRVVCLMCSFRHLMPARVEEGPMAITFRKLTPNLVVSNVERSVQFYRDVLGFQFAFGVPEAEPRVFAAIVHIRFHKSGYVGRRTN